MSAQPKLATPDVLLPSVDYAREPAGGDSNETKVSENNPVVAVQPKSAQPIPELSAKPIDPLSPLKAMTEEEIIALFT